MASCLAGGVAGWIGHTVWMSGQVPDRVGTIEPVTEVQIHNVGGDSDGLLPARDIVGDTDVLSQVALLYESEQFMMALEVLLVSDRLAQGQAERVARLRWLERILDAIERQLTEERRSSAFDPVLESVILAMPDQWRYFFQLGEFRVQFGDDDGAARVLSQIENHPDYGPDARRLLEQIDQRQRDQVSGVVTIPLIPHRGQFLVPCRIGDRQLNLLLDTGAALTVISPSQARKSGLHIGDDVRYFSTAGGVIQAPVVVAGQFVLGGESTGQRVVVSQLSLGIIDIPFSHGESAYPIDGLLGMNVLGRFRFRLDQETPALHLLPVD
ncbi:MAG: retropepsin-like aspartic protease [Pseudomonadota bacterium]